MKKLFLALSMLVCGSSSLLLADNSGVVSQVESLISDAQVGNQEAIDQLKQIRQLMIKNRINMKINRLQGRLGQLNQNLNAATDDVEKTQLNGKITWVQNRLNKLNDALSSDQPFFHSRCHKSLHGATDEQLISDLNTVSKGTWRISKRINCLENRVTRLSAKLNDNTLDQQRTDSLSQKIAALQGRIANLQNALSAYQTTQTTQ